jgi:hypothetical protein
MRCQSEHFFMGQQEGRTDGAKACAEICEPRYRGEGWEIRHDRSMPRADSLIAATCLVLNGPAFQMTRTSLRELWACPRDESEEQARSAGDPIDGPAWTVALGD